MEATRKAFGLAGAVIGGTAGTAVGGASVGGAASMAGAGAAGEGEGGGGSHAGAVPPHPVSAVSERSSPAAAAAEIRLQPPVRGRVMPMRIFRIRPDPTERFG